MAPDDSKKTELRQHGVKGVYYGGHWLDIEDCDGVFTNLEGCSGCCRKQQCPRSRSTHVAIKRDGTYDVLIVGAGCIGASIARELSRYSLSTLWVEAADDVSQGATKGNSGIVHAGYDDKPGSVRAKYCWKGNQMFAQLDRELRFGYQTNGSLVLAFEKKDLEHLQVLKKRGEINGVQRLRILTQDELRELEPHVNPEAIGALYSPDAGNVIPYEFTIALAENAVDNGVELRIRRQVTDITYEDNMFSVRLCHWEPKQYVEATELWTPKQAIMILVIVVTLIVSSTMGIQLIKDENVDEATKKNASIATYTVLLVSMLLIIRTRKPQSISKMTPLSKLVDEVTPAVGKGGSKVAVDEMMVGGSGASHYVTGEKVATEVVKAKYVINCAGGASDTIAHMIGDDSFTIKPRLGDYLLLNRNQGHLTTHTLFPCPDPVLGKGVLVQTTLWGNLILGPTARDTYKPEARDMTDASVQEYILSKCKHLVPTFDPKETFHAFCGARAKSTRGDWIVEFSSKNSNMIHVAGIDSPGLAGAPAIAVDVVKMLQEAGLSTPLNPTFNPNRAPIITPKVGMRGLKMGPVGKNDSDGVDEKKMASNVICKCEKVTELEVVRAVRRSLPIDSTQAIRKRTRAGMGHCQGDPDNYNCEARVKAIIARELGVPVSQVGGRPWPATSTLPERWIDDDEKQVLQNLMKK